MTPGSAWLIGASAAACLVAAPAFGQTSPSQSQTSRVSHWGVLVSVSPSWYLPGSITDGVAKDGGGLVVVGSQFEIGIVRGRTTSGDWGVTFVHQPVKK